MTPEEFQKELDRRLDISDVERVFRFINDSYRRKDLAIAAFKRLTKKMEDLNTLLDLAVEEFEKLAKLGNEPHYGNSTGNEIAFKAASVIKTGRKMIEVK